MRDRCSRTSGPIKIRKELTGTSELLFDWVPSTPLASVFAVGVTGKECADVADWENKILLREKDLEVEGLSGGLSESGVSGTMRTVFSPSCEVFLTLVLFWGSKLLTDEINLAECGLGGKPDRVELGLGLSILVKLEKESAMVLSGTWREERVGRLGCWVKADSCPSTCWLQHNQIQNPEYLFMVIKENVAL